MSETYASDYEPETTGGFLIAAISVLAGILVLAGLFYATGAHARNRAALALNDCEPSLSPSGLPCNTQQMVIARYQGIVTPVGQQLNAAMIDYQANEGNHLAAAEAALTSEVATEQALDNSLAAAAYTSQNYATALSQITVAADNGTSTPSTAILLTPQTTVMADALVKDNQALTTLTAEQAKSTSLTQLRSFNSRVAAANAVVLNDINAIHKALAAPIVAAQEP
jgi:altronate dehydratase